MLNNGLLTSSWRKAESVTRIQDALCNIICPQEILTSRVMIINRELVLNRELFKQARAVNGGNGANQKMHHGLMIERVSDSVQ